MAPKVLVVLTSADKIVKLDKPTGWYLPELAHPYDVLSEAKADVVVASPNGGVAPLDQSSVEAFASDPSSVNFFENHKSVWETTKPLKDFVGRASEFDAIFYPGGHGPMYDLVDDKHSMALIEEFYEAGKIVSAVCHGPIVFRGVKVDGRPLLDGRTVTGFTNEEEELMQLADAMPMLLEDELKKIGANFVRSDKAWEENVVVDGRIITGQNPASAKAIAEALVKALGT
ncbi:ThiJ/PfpI family protein [Drechmeria coniospora]|uniref:D-lactate dehydratase n=1 Tax=Drechmeria coniospora TaxID=98403 RepID=A0A151GJE9_DRECN|nr:ThiJ/PfpI family protein [Drechmeria coniospora]KYK57208.1 ThiJ/PfpI family protein [Drechmeria coniospora]